MPREVSKGKPTTRRYSEEDGLVGLPSQESTVEELDVFVEHGTSEQRWHAAPYEHLSRWAMERLADDPDIGVRTSLLDNPALPAVLLARMHAANPPLRARIAEHHNAPATLKAPVPLWRHSSLAVEVYARDVGASADVTARLLEAHADVARDDPLTLAEAFEAAQNG